MKQVLIILFLFVFSHCTAQQNVFTEQEFLSVISKYHPVLKQAELDVLMADASVRSSRGQFDPVISSEMNRKELDGLRYYNVRQTEIRIPTWYGVDIYTGRENITGTRINPEETKGQLNYIGFSVPLVQNLVMDKRRAALQQARIFRDLSEVQRQSVVNDLLAEAIKDYWNWWQHYQLLELMQSFRDNAEQRLKMVRLTWKVGERAAIDTLEALTQVQSIFMKQQEVQAELMKAQLELSTYLWTEHEKQFELPSDVKPQTWEANETLLLDDLLRTAAQHPELAQYPFKFNLLEVDKKLKFQSLLPKVNLKYNQIGSDLSKTATSAWFQNNYRFGIAVAMPLRLSEGRGEYRRAVLKLDQARLEQLTKQVQIRNKVQQYYTDWQQTRQQLALQQHIVQNTKALQRGEETKFQNGESSLFLVNARELKTMETIQKLVELQSKNRKAWIDVQWSAGGFSR